MDDFGGIAILILIWIIGAAFDQKRKQEAKRRRKVQSKPAPPPLSIEVPVSESEQDASQREGSRLEQVLRQLNPELADLADNALEQAKAEKARKKKESRPARRPEALPVQAAPQDDFQAKAERAIARRRAVAERHGRGRTEADHAEFHEEIRRKVPVVEPKEGRFPSLQEAFVWREILGPPKALE